MIKIILIGYLIMAMWCFHKALENTEVEDMAIIELYFGEEYEEDN